MGRLLAEFLFGAAVGAGEEGAVAVVVAFVGGDEVGGAVVVKAFVDVLRDFFAVAGGEADQRFATVWCGQRRGRGFAAFASERLAVALRRGVGFDDGRCAVQLWADPDLGAARGNGGDGFFFGRGRGRCAHSRGGCGEGARFAGADGEVAVVVAAAAWVAAVVRGGREEEVVRRGFGCFGGFVVFRDRFGGGVVFVPGVAAFVGFVFGRFGGGGG